jgi:aromatic ring hydroxylase
MKMYELIVSLRGGQTVVIIMEPDDLDLSDWHDMIKQTIQEDAGYFDAKDHYTKSWHTFCGEYIQHFSIRECVVR